MVDKNIKISIVGVTGYSGLELLRLLYNHPNAEVISIHNTQQTHTDISEQFPHLKKMYNLTTMPFDSVYIMQHADIVFFATSSGVSKDLASEFIEAKFPVIDLSGDFRLPASLYKKWYKKEPASDQLLQQAHYSLADFYNNNATYIANPGCYATATLLALAPLAQHQVLDKDNIIIDAKSGLSGAGKSLTSTSHFVNVSDNFSMYKANQHQHIPEITQQLQKWQPDIEHIQFTTSLLPINRGIFISAYVKINDAVQANQIDKLYKKTYANTQFVRIMSQNQLPNIKQVIGTNFTDIGITYNPDTRYLTIVSVLDNMIKGAAGQAIQNMNHFFGLEESTGLHLLAQYA
ncbi:N-acetyl-gamma-glutamyl-phosphate reductase [Leuconostoc litchii]|uniref:N-acetyl-gamma-glutamyl-phosphate reductase n=1 Tax=Leuconostoc litchii TaxID=1981069 RepID=A0A6P2CK47_9LACO|nr:N-acetyl-gamma-glutamyl-phosphate reductase [Leuconostoc litchii]TYC46233.1 N-acetyl-gamma-glutamyl-phosphate reductase [Leuconostoc litchii]GMA69937.1 N-acetyl-gamma-glutamyl-phosphate reductase [Leuconostoc litchii]